MVFPLGKTGEASMPRTLCRSSKTQPNETGFTWLTTPLSPLKDERMTQALSSASCRGTSGELRALFIFSMSGHMGNGSEEQNQTGTSIRVPSGTGIGIVVPTPCSLSASLYPFTKLQAFLSLQRHRHQAYLETGCQRSPTEFGPRARHTRRYGL